MTPGLQTVGSTCSGLGGSCLNTTINGCFEGHYEMGLCPDDGYDVRCCVPGGNQGKKCNDATAKKLACEVLAHHRAGKLTLDNRHPSGVPDNAYPLQNIKDACAGRQVLRSSYVCDECPTGAPGGYVCLTSKLLQYISNLTKYARPFITSLAGACHSCSSRHYRGLAVDMSLDTNTGSYVADCLNLGGYGEKEIDHVHCEVVD